MKNKIMIVSLAEGKAQVFPIKLENFMGALKMRGNFTETCFGEKEIVR